MERLTGDERRDRIITAARREFAVHGYEATKMEMIAEAAGCTTGPLYHFFSSKREVYRAAFLAAATQAVEAVRAAQGALSDGTPLTRLIVTCDTLHELLSARETIHFTQEGPRVFGFEEWHRYLEMTAVPLFEDDLRAAMMEGEIEPEPPRPLAVLLTGAVMTAAANTARANGARDVADSYRSAIQRILLRMRTPTGDNGDVNPLLAPARRPARRVKSR